MTIKWDCRARRACYVRERLPDWAMLAGCFAPEPNVSPMDIDGVVEQNGRFLFLEEKSPAGSLSAKQIVMFKALARQGNTCIAFWGHKNNVQSMIVFGLDGWEPVKRPAGIDDLRSAVSAWWASVYRRKTA